MHGETENGPSSAVSGAKMVKPFPAIGRIVRLSTVRVTTARAGHAPEQIRVANKRLPPSLEHFTQAKPPLARSTWELIQAPPGPARKDTTAAMSSGVPRRSSGDSLAS